MTTRNIFSNFALHSEMDATELLDSDDSDHTGSIMNLSGGTTLAILIPFATAGSGGPVPGSWSITALRLKYFTNPDYNDAPLIEEFDSVTGVSESGNRLVFSDGSPVTFPIEGDNTATTDVFILLNNAPASQSDGTENHHFVVVSVDTGTFVPDTVEINFNYVFYRGPAELAQPGKFLTFDGNNK